MFDDFRAQASDESAFDEPLEEQQEFQPETVEAAVVDTGVTRAAHKKEREPLFLGMTGVQRFVIAFMLFMMSCMMGILILLVTEKIIPPV